MLDDFELFDSADYVIRDSQGAEVPPDGRDVDGQTTDELEIIAQCVHSRIFFAEVVLGVVLEDWQYKVLHDLDSGKTRISIRSGNGAGKTFLLSIIILHFILFRNDVKIPVTAPSSGQLTDGLIPETHKWMGVLPDFLRRLLGTTESRIVRLDNPKNNFVSFRTARKEKPEALQGIHAENVLCVVDEASGVDDAVYEAAQGTLSTPGAIFIMISNPTRLTGYFYNSHHRMKHAWSTYHVTAFDTTRVDQAFIDTIRDTYGLESDQYRVKVLGNFPTREESTLIARELVSAAFLRNIAVTDDDNIMGVDVGRGGDLSALTIRRGHVIHTIKKQNYSDTMQTVGWVVDAYTSCTPRPTAIYVDSIGIGAGVADRLRELGYPAVDVNVSELPSLKMTYPRMRDELWWNVKAWLEARNCCFALFDESEELRDMVEAELSTPLQIFTSSGKNGVETKAQMRTRGHRSPNIADSICLTFAFAGAIGAGQGGSRAANDWNKPLKALNPAHVH